MFVKFRVRCEIAKGTAKVVSLRLARGELFVNHDDYAQFLKEITRGDQQHTYTYVISNAYGLEGGYVLLESQLA